jgi:ribosomal 50S subunit-recycling heat shock protein
MKTRKEKKAEKRQRLLIESGIIGVNTELIKKGQRINCETVLSMTIGSGKCTVTLSDGKNCRTKLAKNIIIDNQPISYIDIN